MKLTTVLYVAIVFLIATLIKAATPSNENICQNVWKFPPKCTDNCTYQLVWRFKPLEDSIDFIVSSRHTKRWTGVGFASDKSLLKSDAIFAWIEENSRYVMMDAYMPTYSTPIPDKQQSISNISATLSNGLISFRFTRKRDTGDPSEDLIFGDDKCPYLVYPVEGGSVDIKNRDVITSEHEPHVSETPICIRACDYKQPSSTISSTLASVQPATSTTTRAPTSTTRRPTTTTSTTRTTAPTTTTTTTRKPATTTSTITTSTTTTTTTTVMPPTTTSRPSTTTSSTTTTQHPPTTTTTAPPTTTTPVPIKPSVSNLSTSSQEEQSGRQWCVGRWSHPPNCHFQPGPATADTLAYLKQPIDETVSIKPLPLELSDCSYMAQWQYLEQIDSVEFIIQTKTRNRWTGIGFSNSTRMANSDAIIGLIEELSGRHFIMDTWLRDHVMPEIDQHQNTESTWGKRENGTTTVRFRRKRVTGDQFDFQFTDESCAYFFFPTQGGSFNAISKRMHKHESVPSVSKQRICIKSCAPASSGSKLRAPASPVSVGVDRAAASSPVEATQATVAATSQTAESSSSTVASDGGVGQSPSSNLATAPTTNSPPASHQPTTSTGGGGSQQQQQEAEKSNNINLSSSNDLGADIDSSSSTSSASNGSQASSIQQQNNASSSGHKLNSSVADNSNPFGKLTFLTEPSLRWLAGIGCVATLLAMIVFQACFTVYKNKQAYKQNLYRQSALKQNAAAYLHGAYIGDGASAVSSSAGGADLHQHSSRPLPNSMGLNGSADHPPHHSHSHHPHHPHSHSHPKPQPQPHGQHPNSSHLTMAAGDGGGGGGHHVRANANSLGLRRTESSVLEEEELEEVEEDEMEEMEELEEADEELDELEEELEEELEDFEYDESSFYYNHPHLQHHRHPQHHHPSRPHAVPMGAPHASSNHSGHAVNHRHASLTHQQQHRMHPSHQQQLYSQAQPVRNHAYQAQAHQQHNQHHHQQLQPLHHRQSTYHHQQPLPHRHNSRNPYHMQQQQYQMGGNQPIRPDSYFLPSQRRY